MREQTDRELLDKVDSTAKKIADVLNEANLTEGQLYYTLASIVLGFTRKDREETDKLLSKVAEACLNWIEVEEESITKN